MNRTSRLQFAFLFICAGSLSPVYLFKVDATPWLAIAGLVASALAYLYISVDIYRDDKLSVSVWYLLGTAALIRFAALPVPIFMDGEVYRAIWDGWLQQQSMNPYAHVPSSQSLNLLHSSTLFQLLTDAGAYTAFNPMQEVLYRITGVLYDHFGLGTTILIQKGMSAILDLSIIASLWHAFKEWNRPTSYLLLLAWNPLLVLFITSQGLFIQLSGLMFIWICLLWRRHQNFNLGLVWGGWMLTSPLGWILWPYSWRKLGWKWIWIPLVTVIIWWIPFVRTADPLHFLIGNLYEWVQPTTNLSLGYVASLWLTDISTRWTYLYVGLVFLALLGIASLLILVRRIDAELDEQNLALQTWYFALGLLIFYPDFSSSLWLLLIISSLIAGRYQFLSSALTVWGLFNLWFLTSASYPSFLLPSGLLLLLILFYFFPKKNMIRSYLRA
jgi:hypothetical protein